VVNVAAGQAENRRATQRTDVVLLAEKSTFEFVGDDETVVQFLAALLSGSGAVGVGFRPLAGRGCHAATALPAEPAAFCAAEVVAGERVYCVALLALSCVGHVDVPFGSL